MNVQELIDRLQDMIDGGDIQPETIVKFVYQSNYPLQDNVKGIWFAEGQGVENVGEVYIVSAGQDHNQPYGPGTAFEEAW